jgi:hypothetical protein
MVSAMARPPGLATLVATIAATLAIAACGGGDDPEPTASEPTAEPPPPAEPAEEESPQSPDDAQGSEEGETEGEDAGEDEREAGEDETRAVERAVNGYVEAIDARDGTRVCALLAPGALDGVPLPRERGGCAASLDASIGYRDPRGLPQFKRARLATVTRSDLSQDEASVTATVLTTFADRDEPSLEDDVIYLVRAGERWLIVKASSTLYRAIGAADVPPSVLSPP